MTSTMRSLLMAILIAGLGIACTESALDLSAGGDVGATGDATNDRDGGTEDTGPADDGVQMLCCSDLLCEGCNGAEYLTGGCGPEWCEPPFPGGECDPVLPSECPDCRQLSEAECGEGDRGRPGCKRHVCDGEYRGCVGFNEPTDCNFNCEGLDEISCHAEANCHSSYEDGDVCDCNEPGCCMTFSYCAAGGVANCNGVPLCQVPELVCGDGYTPAFVNECYEGCARIEDCG